MTGKQRLSMRDDRIRGLTEKQRRILAYLVNHVDSQTYFKSRRIGERIGLSSKEVGRNIIELNDVGIEIEKWGYSSGTTWKVTA